MRPLLLFLTFLQLSAFQPLYPQATRLVQQTKDTLHQNKPTPPSAAQRLQDSLEREKVMRQILENSQPLDEFLEEMKEQERREKRRLFIRIGAGVIFLFALFFAIARRKKARGD